MIDNYEDILHFSHHVSTNHPRMSLLDRAAQFAPFSALTGHISGIKETARLTDERLELDEQEQENLRKKLNDIQCSTCLNTKVTFTYFEPDKQKDGGIYITIAGYVKKIDEYERMVYLMDGMKISIEEIIAIELS